MIISVIVAAGKGTRLGADRPKIFLDILGKTVLDILYNHLIKVSDRVHLVLSTSGCKYFAANFSHSNYPKLTISIQEEQKGMGDAIFGAYEYWGDASKLLVIWGDQVNVSFSTLLNLTQHNILGNAFVIPLVKMKNPYVQYKFHGNKIYTILQSREGDICDEEGFADIGTFLLNNPRELKKLWDCYVSTAKMGANTSELNFLPFLKYLSDSSWLAYKFIINNDVEARGINTRDDLNFVINKLING